MEVDKLILTNATENLQSDVRFSMMNCKIFLAKNKYTYYYQNILLLIVGLLACHKKSFYGSYKLYAPYRCKHKVGASK